MGGGGGGGNTGHGTIYTNIIGYKTNSEYDINLLYV